MYFHAMTTDRRLTTAGRPDFASQVDYGDSSTVSRRFLIVYSQFLPSQLRPEDLWSLRNNASLADYFAKLKVCIDNEIPDPAFDGPVCLDYEIALNYDLLVARGDHERWPGTPDQYDNWLAMVLGRTIDRIRELRPKARIGLYDTPIRHSPSDYVEARLRHDSLHWLWKRVSVLFPDCYLQARSIQSATWDDYSDGIVRPTFNQAVIAEQINEAKRISLGCHEVIPFSMLRYDRPTVSGIHRRFLEDVDFNSAFRLPMAIGADGVALWDSFGTLDPFDPDRAELQAAEDLRQINEQLRSRPL